MWKHILHCNFKRLSSSERILKIGWNFTKLSSQYGGTFFETQCIKDYKQGKINIYGTFPVSLLSSATASLRYHCNNSNNSNTLAVSIAAAVPVKPITTGKDSLLLSCLSMTIRALDCLVRVLMVSPYRPTNTPKKFSDTPW